MGGLLLMLTNFIKDTAFVSEPLVALLAGVVGPAVLGLLDLDSFGEREEILGLSLPLAMLLGAVVTPTRWSQAP